VPHPQFVPARRRRACPPSLCLPAAGRAGGWVLRFSWSAAACRRFPGVNATDGMSFQPERTGFFLRALFARCSLFLSSRPKWPKAGSRLAHACHPARSGPSLVRALPTLVIPTEVAQGWFASCSRLSSRPKARAVCGPERRDRETTPPLHQTRHSRRIGPIFSATPNSGASGRADMHGFPSHVSSAVNPIAGCPRPAVGRCLGLGFLFSLRTLRSLCPLRDSWPFSALLLSANLCVLCTSALSLFLLFLASCSLISVH